MHTLLKDVKRCVGNDLAEDILSVRKGPREKVKVTLKENSEGRTTLKSRGGSQIQGLVVMDRSKGERMVSVHIKDLDLETMKEELTEAVKKEVGADEEIRVTSLRPAFGSMKNAMMVLAQKHAGRLT